MKSRGQLHMKLENRKHRLTAALKTAVTVMITLRFCNNLLLFIVFLMNLDIKMSVFLGTVRSLAAYQHILRIWIQKESKTYSLDLIRKMKCNICIFKWNFVTRAL